MCEGKSLNASSYHPFPNLRPFPTCISLIIFSAPSPSHDPNSMVLVVEENVDAYSQLYPDVPAIWIAPSPFPYLSALALPCFSALPRPSLSAVPLPTYDLVPLLATHFPGMLHEAVHDGKIGLDLTGLNLERWVIWIILPCLY